MKRLGFADGSRSLTPNKDLKYYEYAPDLIDHLAKQGVEIDSTQGGRAYIRPRFDLKRGTLKIHIPEERFVPIGYNKESVDWYGNSRRFRGLIADEIKHAGQITDWESISKNPIARSLKGLAEMVMYGDAGQYTTKGTYENIHDDPDRYNPILKRYGITDSGDIIGKQKPETEKELYSRLGLKEEYDAMEASVKKGYPQKQED